MMLRFCRHCSVLLRRAGQSRSDTLPAVSPLIQQVRGVDGVDGPERHLGEKKIIKAPPLMPRGVAISKDPEEWKFVERLLPDKTVPKPPQHESYPTPSGWVPPKESSKNLPYHVRRTRFHNFPVYLETFDGGNRKMTVIKYVEGDIWAMENDLRSFLSEKILDKVIYTQVDEVCTKIRVRGTYQDEVAEFLLLQGL